MPPRANRTLLICLLTLPVACGRSETPPTTERAPERTPATESTPAPAPTLPTALSFELTGPQPAAADAMRKRLDGGLPVVPKRENIHVWLAVMTTYDHEHNLLRNLIKLGQHYGPQGHDFAAVVEGLEADTAMVGARLANHDQVGVQQTAIKEILGRLLRAKLNPDLRAAIETMLVATTADQARHPHTRAIATAAIGEPTRMAEACLGLFESSDPYVVWYAIEACEHTTMINRVVGLTRHRLPPIRARAVQVLARMLASGDSGRKFVTRYIMPMLDDEEAHVRGAAIWALGRLAKQDAMADLTAERLAGFLQDTTPTAYSHTWSRSDGSDWGQGNVPLLADQGTLSAHAYMAFNQVSGGAIKTDLHLQSRPGDGDRSAAAEEARAWLRARPRPK